MTIDNVTAYLYDCIDRQHRFPHIDEITEIFHEVDIEEVYKEVKHQAKVHDLSGLNVEWDYLKQKEHAAATNHALDKNYHLHYTKEEIK